MRWHECREKIRFHEVDSFNILWHGNYIKYFEIGRLGLCARFGLSPDEMRALGYYAPVIDLGCTFKEPARYGNEILIRTTVDPTEKAMLTFRYVLLRVSDGKILSEGHTTHVLLTLDGGMLYMVPPEIEGPVRELIAYCNE